MESGPPRCATLAGSFPDHGGGFASLMMDVVVVEPISRCGTLQMYLLQLRQQILLEYGYSNWLLTS
jgi:hypothetical protein